MTSQFQWIRFIEQLKNIPILSVCQLLNIHVYRGNKIHCISPNHPDENPSLRINIAKNYWKCFSCGECGDVITFVMVATGLEFKDSCQWLASNFNILYPQFFSYKYRRVQVQPQSRKIEKGKTGDSFKPDIEVMSWIVSQGILSDEAKRFLFDGRKLSLNVIESLHIFSISDKDRFIKAIVNAFGEDRCIKSHLLTRSFGQLSCCFLLPAIIFPFYDENGDLVTLQSRTLFPQKPSDRFRFPKESPIIPYNLQSLSNLEAYDTVYITEGVTDCLAHLSEGHNAIAFPGAQSFSPQYAHLLERFTLKMYPDNDDAGQSLYSKLADSIQTSVFRLKLPDEVKDYSGYHILRYDSK